MLYIVNILSRNLKRLRKESGYSQEALSDKACLSLRYLGDIERGKANPTLDILNNLAKSLKLELWELFFKDAAEVRYHYALREDPLINPDNRRPYLGYSLCIYKIIGRTSILIECIPDISPNKAFAEQVVRHCNEHKLSLLACFAYLQSVL